MLSGLGAKPNHSEKVHAQLKKIETIQRRWNALSISERAAIAKHSPDLTSFFRPEGLARG
jgi:hypothetical protein